MSEQTQTYAYDQGFFEYIEIGARSSAEVVVARANAFLKPKSVLDVGCGRGLWCSTWMSAGVPDVIGVDGTYVDVKRLAIPERSFRGMDLSQEFDLGRRFDLAMSLEVAEHIPPASSDAFVNSLVRHSDVVMFSAAVPGQSGENHINERPLEDWRQRFQSRGYSLFDPLRPLIASDARVEPWYRYNTLLFVAKDQVARLPQEIRDAEIAAGQPIPQVAPFYWRARNAVLGSMPQSVTNRLALVKHALVRATHSVRH